MDGWTVLHWRSRAGTANYTHRKDGSQATEILHLRRTAVEPKGTRGPACRYHRSPAANGISVRVLGAAGKFRQTLGAESRSHLSHSRDVATWARQAGNETGLDRISCEAAHHNRNGTGGPTRRHARGRARSHDQISLRRDQLGRELWEPLVVSFGEPVVDDNVPTLDITMLAEPLQKAFDQEGPTLAGANGEETDPSNLRSRLFEPFATGQQDAGDQGQNESHEPRRHMARVGWPK